jgi:hypothetical protein
MRSQRFLLSAPRTGGRLLAPLRGVVAEYRGPRRRRSFSAISFLSEVSALKADVEPPPAERPFPGIDLRCPRLLQTPI